MAEDEPYDMFDEEGSEIVNAEGNGELGKKPQTLLESLEITVTDPDKRTVTKGSLKMQESYVAYLVETKPRDVQNMNPMIEEVTSVWRRYSEFELLRNYLVVTYPAIVMPPLPEKRASFLWTKITTDAFDQDFVERRRAGLEIFLHRICSFPNTDIMVVTFLKQEEGWRESVMATGYQAKADSWLRTLNASLRVKQPDPGFVELKDFAADLQSSIGAVLKARAKLADRVYGLYKIHSNYSRIFKEWSSAEDKSMAEALRKASTLMEELANSIDLLMEEEELYAEQLKEYFNFANSLKAIIKKHEALQYNVEMAENQLMSAHLEKKQISTGAAGFNLSGMKARIFGGDTPEQRELKLSKIEENIRNLKEALEEKRNVSDTFTSEAKEEILKFKRQKQADLREIMTNYVILQIKMAKGSKAYWSRFKASIQSA